MSIFFHSKIFQNGYFFLLINSFLDYEMLRYNVIKNGLEDKYWLLADCIPTTHERSRENEREKKNTRLYMSESIYSDVYVKLKGY